MKKIKPVDLKGFIEQEHQPYTDYNQEIVDWLKDNAEADRLPNLCRRKEYIFTQEENFYTHYCVFSSDIYYTNEQFMEWIGMPKKSSPVKDKLEELLKTDGQEVIKWMNNYFNKKESIQKELELVEAKKQRLENHINILKSKLK